MTGNETEDGKKDDGYDIEYYEKTGGKEIDELKQQVEDMRREVGNVANQVNTANKFSMMSSICLIILGVIILVLLGVGVAMIVKTKSNASDEDNGQGAVGGEANPECTGTPTTELTEGTKLKYLSCTYLILIV